MKNRSIKSQWHSQKVNMGGIILDQPLPTQKVDTIDPFILIHHWNDKVPAGRKQKEVGVGPHPHRGFSPVTFIFKRAVHHRDSLGTSSIIREGGTQWMNSGRGIVHSERPNKELAENGGDFELIQFWVNAPAAHKMDPPSYQPITAEETPKVKSPDGKVELGVVCGEYEDKKGKVSPHSEMLICRLNIESGGKMSVKIPNGYNALVYQLDGKMRLNDSEGLAKDIFWLEADGDGFEVEGIDFTRAILLAGKPINEPISTYGPFVMNTQTEIMQALRDYQMGKMGVLIEDFD